MLVLGVNKRGIRDLDRERFWRSAIERQLRSGLSQNQFCLQEKLNPNSFSAWKSIIKGRDAAQLNKRVVKPKTGHERAPAFLPVVVFDDDSGRCPSDLAPMVEVVFSGSAVRVFPGADENIMRAILAVLKEKS